MRKLRSHFNPRSPHGERPPKSRRAARKPTFQSTLPARGATGALKVETGATVFQSTLPARGATRYPYRPCTGQSYFNPRSPHGERRRPAPGAENRQCISIHAPRTGSDTRFRWVRTARADFNPRSPHGERPFSPVETSAKVMISIHAPRTGSDRQDQLAVHALGRFQSTLPARGATYMRAPQDTEKQFQSTLPARGATPRPGAAAPAGGISIHAPRTGSDVPPPRHGGAHQDFNPRSPHGERRTSGRHPCGHPAISIHAPRTGSDHSGRCGRPFRTYFNPRSPHGERRRRYCRCPCADGISIHAPRTGSDQAIKMAQHYDAISIHAPRTGSDSAK